MYFNIVRKEIARTSTITMALLSMLQKRKCNLRNHNINNSHVPECGSKRRRRNNQRPFVCKSRIPTKCVSVCHICFCYFSFCALKNLGFSVCVSYWHIVTVNFPIHLLCDVPCRMIDERKYGMQTHKYVNRQTTTTHARTRTYACGSTILWTLISNFTYGTIYFCLCPMQKSKSQTQCQRMESEGERERELDREKFISGLTNYLSICLLS